MLEKRIREQLDDAFPKPNRTLWQETAQQETDGKDPFEVLKWQSAGNTGFSAYYDKTDVNSLDYLHKFELPPATDPYSGPRAWTNLPPVTVSDIATAQTQALNHLQQGADGILFQFTASSPAFTPSLLESIDWPYCNVSFRAGQASQLAGLADYVRSQYASQQLQGILLWPGAPEKAAALCSAFPQSSGLRALGITIPAGDALQEIVTALTTGVNLLDTLTTQGLPAAEILYHISFSIEAGADIFTTVAKYKALRMLWFQVARAYGHTTYTPADLALHARSAPWIHEKYQPHGNLLKSTTASLSAVLGGCSLLTVEPEEAGHSTMERIARNVSSILREESHLDKVADPLAGAYAVDVMVHTFAAKAWSQFQAASAAQPA